MTSLTTPNVSSSAQQLTHIKYRSDIDGLRAIAILLVVIFHGFPTILRGGFIGVDVFFVISGFLITSIIFRSLQSGSFSFVDFYSRRIKRIFPGLLLILAASCILGWFILLDDDYKQLGKHIAGGAGFISNFILKDESGYFDNSADTKPLLHLWSLGIEEQFYIVWPVLIALAYRFRINLLATLSVFAAISFYLNLHHISTHPSSTFYSPQTRFWELLIGAFLAYLPLQQNEQPKHNLLHRISGRLDLDQFFIENRAGLLSIQSLLGATLIIIGLVSISEDRPFPGSWALLPTIGTALIISATPSAWLNRVILSNRLLVWIGLISFPLYLWHWPLLTFAHFVWAGSPSATIRTGAIALSVILAWSTYRFVELPLRLGKHQKINTVGLIASMLAVGGVGYNIYTHDGYSFRLSDRQEFSDYFENSLPDRRYFTKIGLPEKFRVECDFYDGDKYIAGNATTIPRDHIDTSCYQKTSTQNKAVFIWGDSHAKQLNSGLKNNLPKNWEILQVAGSACAANPNVTGPSATDYCAQSNWFALESIKRVKPETVIIAQNLNYDVARLVQITTLLKANGVKKVILVGPSPHWVTPLPKVIMNSLWVHTPRQTVVGVDKQVISDNEQLKKNLMNSGAVFADLIGLLCGEEGCLTYLGDDIRTGITSWDYGHLTPAASDYVAKKLLANLVTDDPSLTQEASK